MLRSAAHQLSAGLRAAQLHERLDRAQRGTAEALKAALDAAREAPRRRSLVQRCEAVGLALGLDEARAAARCATPRRCTTSASSACPRRSSTSPGRCDERERPAIERHPLISEGILSPVEFLADTVPLVRAAHERWDGTGYPDGLAGEKIPLGARILFACDTYEAMITDRPYREALGPRRGQAGAAPGGRNAARPARRGGAARGAGPVAAGWPAAQG